MEILTIIRIVLYAICGGIFVSRRKWIGYAACMLFLISNIIFAIGTDRLTVELIRTLAVSCFAVFVFKEYWRK